ncbi:phosphoserine phosphatase SerB [Paraneptunicella aestuarii]|uniref:phosphoserine phosphatase SerB n=1 Tax=Paraneptunicella aestuarii TaxID=2831148 RepID=UPI001E5FEBBB|nr:phosphoserine phosphatase SerB [Paraneptunicella aestuarii]UAA40079.1 phosphoserine phosphatase SerB [Paraneptunicella aestuarii]
MTDAGGFTIVENGLVSQQALSENSDSYEALSNFKASEGWQLIVIADALNLEKLDNVAQALSAQVITGLWHVSESRASLPEHARLVAKCEVEVTESNGLSALIEQASLAHQVELVLCQNAPKLNEPGLLVMDMDSTVIKIECIDEIAILAGVGKEVSEVTELAMQGKLDFAQSLTQRVACLENADESILQTVRNALPLMPGIEVLVGRLQECGWKVAIASGGFTYFADYLKERLGLEAAVSNTLDIQDGKLTGKVRGDIVDAKVKAQTVESLAQQYGIPMHQTVAMGDGANDLVMMATAGLGVAYKAKPVVREQAQTSIRFSGLDTLLDYLR